VGFYTTQWSETGHQEDIEVWIYFEDAKPESTKQNPALIESLRSTLCFLGVSYAIKEIPFAGLLLVSLSLIPLLNAGIKAKYTPGSGWLFFL